MNEYHVAIRLKGQDELTGYLRQAEKSFGALGQTARLSLVPMGNWSRELGAAARLAREAGPEVVLPLEA